MIRKKVISSNILSIGYDKTSKILEIEFNNHNIYQYNDVPEKIYIDLMSAKSHGKYFHIYINNKFDYKKIK